MGLSSTVSAAFFTILLLTGTAYVVTLNINMMKNTVEPIEEYMAREHNRLGEACTIDSWSISSPNEAVVYITNTGAHAAVSRPVIPLLLIGFSQLILGTSVFPSQERQINIINV